MGAGQGQQLELSTRSRAAQVLPLVLARFPGLLADALSTFAIPVTVYSLTHNARLSGLAFTIQWVPRVLLLPIIGVIVNRFGARRQLVVSDLGRAALCLILAGLLQVDTLIGVGCLLMLLDSHATIASETILATRVESEAIPVAQSGLQTETQISRTAGPAGAGFLLATGDPRLTFLVTGLIFICGGISFAVVLRASDALTPATEHRSRTGAPTGQPGGPGHRRWHRPFQEMMLGATRLRRSAALRKLLGCAFVVNLVGGGLLALLPPLAIGYFRSTASVLGIVMGISTAGSIAISVLIGFLVSWRPGWRMWLAFTPLLALSVVGMCTAPSMAVFGVAFGLWSGGITIFNVWLRARRIALIPPAEFGQTIGFFTATMLAAAPIGGLVLAVFGGFFSPVAILRLIVVVSAGLLIIVLAFSARTSSTA